MGKNSQFLINIGQGLSIMVGLPRINSWNTKSRPKKPKMGTFGFNSQTQSLEYFDGTSWLAAAMTEV